MIRFDIWISKRYVEASLVSSVVLRTFLQCYFILVACVYNFYCGVRPILQQCRSAISVTFQTLYI